MGAKRQGERQRCRVKVKLHGITVSIDFSITAIFSLWICLFPFGVGTTLRFLSKLSVHSYGGTLCSWLFFFFYFCVILLPTSHHTCAATATLNNDTTFSLSPAFSPLTLSCLFAYCFYYFFPFSPSVKLVFFYLLLLHSFLLIT